MQMFLLSTIDLVSDVPYLFQYVKLQIRKGNQHFITVVLTYIGYNIRNFVYIFVIKDPLLFHLETKILQFVTL